jgi:WD40 repeat protein
MSYDDWIDVAELSWSHNGKWLLGAGGDGNIPGQRSIIRLWDAATTETVRTIFPGFHPLWSKDDRQFAGLSEQNGNRVINIWDTETGEILSTLNVGGTGMNTLSWNTDANVFAGGRVEEPVAIWNVNSGQRYDLEALDTSFVENVEWRPHRNQLAIADQYEGVFILDFDFGG